MPAAGLYNGPYGDIYNRHWIVPDYIYSQLPDLLTNIPFIVWNANSAASSLFLLTPTNATGLTLDIAAGATMIASEARTVNLQVTSTAPPTVSASWQFIFSVGGSFSTPNTPNFAFESQVVDWIRELPESPLIETWEWLSDVNIAQDSTEQRASIRRQPRRKLEYPMIIGDDSERRLWYNRIAQYTGQKLIIPAYQYTALVTQTSAIGVSKVFFDSSKTDLRDGEYLVVYRPTTKITFLLKTTTIVSDGANLPTPLSAAVNVGDFVAPGSFGYLANSISIQSRQITGETTIGSYFLDPRSSFTRPGSAAVITTFDGLSVLDKRPVITRSKADEVVDGNPLIIDNQAGKPDVKTSWLHSFFSGKRQFTLRRTEMDYWRDFLNGVMGQREPFLLSTWHEDLKILSTTLGANQLTVEKSNYATQYFPFDTYKRLQFLATDGSIVYRKVTSATPQTGDQSVIVLSSPLPVTSIWASGVIASYLNRTRLATDDVKFTHFSSYSLLDIAVRTTDQ